ncbi:Oxidoreductase family, NAD-binding Rossmann fold [compost metagenome]
MHFLKGLMLYILLPRTTHYEYIRKALEQSKHVFCEKLLVLQTAQAEELYS